MQLFEFGTSKRAVSFSFVVSAADSTVRVWDRYTGELLHTLVHTATITSFQHDQFKVLSATVVASALLIIGDNCRGIYFIDHCRTGPPFPSTIGSLL
jgi:WD40 repeat protein